MAPWCPSYGQLPAPAAGCQRGAWSLSPWEGRAALGNSDRHHLCGQLSHFGVHCTECGQQSREVLLTSALPWSRGTVGALQLYRASWAGELQRPLPAPAPQLPPAHTEAPHPHSPALGRRMVAAWPKHGLGSPVAQCQHRQRNARLAKHAHVEVFPVSQRSFKGYCKHQTG